MIVIAANGTVHDAVEAMHAGASDYLLKPFSAETLEKTVKKAIYLSNGNGQSKYNRKSPGDEPIGKEIITRNRKFRDMLSRARSVAPSTATVLIQGESGTGKELIARAIHFNGPRRRARLVSENCGAIPSELIESELRFAITEALDEAGITSRSPDPANPAASVVISEESAEPYQGWLFASMPDIHPYPHCHGNPNGHQHRSSDCHD